MITVASNHAAIVTALAALTDAELIDVVTAIDDAVDVIQHLAMRPMDEFNDVFNDTPPIIVAELVYGSEDFRPSDAYFMVTDDLVSADEAAYVERLRGSLDELAEAVAETSDVLATRFVKLLGLGEVAE